jgi:hypothetical protein
VADEKNALLNNIRTLSVKVAEAAHINWIGVSPNIKLGCEKTSGFGTSCKQSCRGACYSGMIHLVKGASKIPLPPIRFE